MALNQEQEATLTKLIMFLAQPSKKDLIIDAPAGCGKGYLLNHVYQNRTSITERVRLLNENFKGEFHLTATTNEAVSVLQESSGTIYSFAGLRPKQNTFVTTKMKNSAGMVVFIDEASYIGREAYHKIRLQLPKAKIVWVMDEFQLADVNEKKAYVSTLGFPKLTMSKVMRNQGAIQQASLELREAVRNELNVDIRKYHNGVDIVVLPPDEFDKALANAFTFDEPVKYLGYTNHQVNTYNNAIHQRVFKNPSFPHAGATGIINKYNEQVNLRCGTPVRITNVTTKWVTLSNSYQDYYVEEVYLDTNRGTLIMCKEDAPWKVYNPNRFLYSDVVLPYGCTVHKSQGQSIDKVFIDLPNLESCFDNEMKRRLRYVGLSRGINKVYIKDYYGN